MTPKYVAIRNAAATGKACRLVDGAALWELQISALAPPPGRRLETAQSQKLLALIEAMSEAPGFGSSLARAGCGPVRGENALSSAGRCLTVN